ncbi:hypothetical protein DICPUDRAFT_39420 [Dictyostelium purpureum]|uniref:Dickkopf N-terminal cysteine-rich domain-containing protein n=1 Tax=Dictyostelium purpureum TaxID=5786 RepID=F0ZWA6_DICPU|nr:uncharacterized protein DICPUDRAFT_39420 [Dictyostelium purpureum]EGC31774.1 hypothetical protein DICPUDRAFT_39420 [Dictyostelium purpureum]|eukprot:XP_003291697.1 hypothetical protein DICPUDRAFT_39420 [Dictyostelium purpureum]
MRVLLSAVLFLVAFASSAYTQDIPQCNYLGKCVKAGERCDQEYYYNNTVPSRIYVTCEYGYFCPEVYEPTCVAYSGLGESCGNNEYQVCDPVYDCTSISSQTNLKTCQVTNYLGFGESCEFDQQCTGSNTECINGKCGILPRIPCSSDRECAYGNFCNITSEPDQDNTCLPVLASSSVCTRDAQCPYNQICVKMAFDSSDATCQNQFSKAEGSYCDRYSAVPSLESLTRYECDIGLTCENPGTDVAKCVKIAVPKTNDVCYNYTQCGESAQCQCSSDKAYDSAGKCTAPSYNQVSTCKTAVINLQKCAFDNKCASYVNFAPDSCLVRNCHSQYCSNACVNENNQPQQCGSAPVNAVCQPASSSSIVLPSFIALIAVFVALLI